MKTLIQRASVFAVVLTLIPVVSWATLGERRRSSDNTLQGSTSTSYTVHESENDSFKLKEYVRQDGVVFGVTWSGLRHPNLQEILGSYWNDYQRETQNNPKKKGTRHYFIQSESIVVKQWGQPRNLMGLAYVPKLLPPGVTADEIK